MDVCVNSEVFDEAAGVLNSVVELMYEADNCRQIVHGVESDFCTVNYETARGHMENVYGALENMQGNLDSVKNYLMNLRDLIEEYDRLRY